MEVGAEAKRIMVVALGKLYSSRSQRGGLRLHRSLLLTLVMKSARDMYHHAAAQDDAYYHSGVPDCDNPAQTDPPPASDDQHHPQQHLQHSAAPQTEAGPGDALTRPAPENTLTYAQQSRKRRGKTSAVPDFLPLKKAKLDFQTQLAALVDYVTCGDLGAVPSPIPVPMAIAAC
ncbi:immediate early response gene 2 protein-like [Eucyclogobius newberryi]|uniref:immediate early response gene 2 protein-like n=1 Tax=Eucyclogobius newberryi TaxID=166745 RepID=UPI003B5B7804